MPIKDLIKQHEDELRRAPKEVELMEARLKEAFLQRCRLWFGDYWAELAVSKIDLKPGVLSIFVTYEGAEIEIRQRLNDAPKTITSVSEHPLPMLNWGRERFPAPLEDSKIAQIVFDAQLGRKEG